MPFQISGTVVTADGRHFELVIPARTEGTAVFRWVALANGSVRGAGRRRRGAGDQFVGKQIVFNRSSDADGFVEMDIGFNLPAGDAFIGKSLDL